MAINIPSFTVVINIKLQSFNFNNFYFIINSNFEATGIDSLRRRTCKEKIKKINSMNEKFQN